MNSPKELTPLILSIANGSEAALEALYELTLSRVYALALCITRRHDLAEETCLETYWQVWREAGRYDASRGQPFAWLMVMTRTRALDVLRRLDPGEPCAEPEIHLDDEQVAEGSALELLLCAERDSALKEALESLSPIQRQVISLAYYKGLSHHEICEHTGLPLGTVKSHMKRAQNSLRAALSDAEGGYDETC